ncbi:MAG: 3-hydroxyacyl-ACP dehydratase FabZ [Terrimicrobiaceae bacterium]
MTTQLAHLPHREPFVFVRELIFAGNGHAECRTWFDAGDPLFAGHFPGDPIVPGVLLTEALAQTSGLAAGEPGRLLLSGIRKMSFRSAVRPDQIIDLFASRVSAMGGLSLFDVRAEVDGVIVAEGQIILSAG